MSEDHRPDPPPETSEATPHESSSQSRSRLWQAIKVEDVPDDLTPFITRTTQDHINGGAFGDVWKCNYNTDGISAVVAVKAFRYPEQYYDSEKFVQKISREIGILKILRHNNIVPLLGTVTGFGQRPELRSLVTPWIPNGTLNAYLASNHNDLTMLDRSRMLEDVSAGLQYLHSVSIMHGDITGANILIDEGGHARLIDFGLSTIVRPLLGQSHLAATSIRPGAIRYAAPELLLDEVCDLSLEKTDIYSFGCVMLQILSGQHPWSEIKSPKAELCIWGSISQGRSPRRPNGHPAILDSDWDIIQKCLQFRSELRPSADQVLDLVMCRRSSLDSSSPFDGSHDDAQDGFPEASLHDDSNNFDITEHLPNSSPPHLAQEVTNAIIDPQAWRSSSCSSLLNLGNTSAVTVFDTACSSLNTGSWPSLTSLGNGPARASETGFRVVQSTGILGHERKQSTLPPLSPPNRGITTVHGRMAQVLPPSRNIVIFGETGVGSSSVINLMAGQQIAHTSPDCHRCTLHWTEYPITFENGTKYKVFDTVGFKVPCLQTGEYLTAISNAYGLINTLKERGGVDLLLFCIRGGRVTAAMQSSYKLFFEFLCEEKVPLVLVITNLEREERMEDWYTRNVGHLKKHNIRSAGHACITAANLLDGRHRDKYEESCGILRRVVEAHCNASMEGWTGGQGWLPSFIGKLVEFVVRRPKKTDIVGILTKRCGMTKEVARQVAQHIRDEN